MNEVIASRDVLIDFMYLDLSTCERCVGTETSLDSAIEKLSHSLGSTGTRFTLRKTLVETAEQARSLGFVTSPTVRVNGIDLALELRESTCGECNCICDTDTLCRVWVYRGNEYEVPPEGLFLDGVFEALYGAARPASGPVADLPSNLLRLFAGRPAKLAAQSGASKMAAASTAVESGDARSTETQSPESCCALDAKVTSIQGSVRGCGPGCC